MSTDHIWVYSTQAHARIFHLIQERRTESDGVAIVPVCDSLHRRQYETSLEPPEHLEMCDKCALHDYEAWLVYKCFAADGEALYAGVTNNLEARMNSHKYCKTYSYRWYPRIARIEAEVFANRYEAGAAEREAIRELQPTFNSTYRKQAWAA